MVDVRGSTFVKVMPVQDNILRHVSPTLDGAITIHH
jgi:hypothetical protein